MVQDVPSPIDFQNVTAVLAWIEDTELKRPWRPQFFKAFADQIVQHFVKPIRLLELGAGPGMLAEEILRTCLVQRYVLLDFSAPMQNLARDRLKAFSHITEHVTIDFRRDGWEAGLGSFDACISMQAVHEVRHKRHIPKLFGQVLKVLRPDSYFWVADHYATPTNNHELYLKAEEQPRELHAAGFKDVNLILNKENMALYRCQKPSGANPATL